MKYLKKLKILKTHKQLKLLSLLVIISFLAGIFLIAILTKENQELITSTITSFFKSIAQNKLNYQHALTTSLTNNLLVNTLIWLLGISIIGIPIVITILILKSLILGFSFSSIIYTYHLKGIIPSLIYIIPHILTLFITFVITYYSISFSLLLYNYLFKKKDYNRTAITKRYVKLLLISSVLLVIASFIEIFLIPFLLQLI